MDFVIASGVQHSVRDFVNAAAAGMDLELEWHGTGQEEYAVVAWSERDDLKFRVGDVVVQVDPRYYRPSEVETLLGDASLAREKLGWSPLTSFDEMVDEMVTTDLQLAREEALINRDRNDQ
jgi:GDPmannose 4,6-dehydratase